MSNPTMKTVSSSLISAIGYDAQSKTAHIKFNTGATVAYKEVPQSVYDGLSSSTSVGSYFVKNIKYAYEYGRV